MAWKWILRLKSLFNASTTEEAQQEKKAKKSKSKTLMESNPQLENVPSHSKSESSGNLSRHQSAGTSGLKNDSDIGTVANIAVSPASSSRLSANSSLPKKQTDPRAGRIRRMSTGSMVYPTWIEKDDVPKPYEVGHSVDTERFRCLESLDNETRRNLMIDIALPLSVYEVILNSRK